MARKYRHHPMQSAFPEIREWLVADLAALPFGEPTWVPGPSPPVVRPHFAGCEPEPRGYARDPARFSATPAADEAAAVVRGVLADRLEADFTGGELFHILFQGDRAPERVRRFVELVIDLAEDRDRVGIWKAFQKFGLDVYQAVAACLFCEIYTGDPYAVGLVPAGGVERVGISRQQAYADLLADAKPKNPLRDVTGRVV